MISLDQVVCKDKKTASRILAGEAIVLTPMNSKIYNLNETGSRIWAWLDDRPTVGDLVARMQMARGMRINVLAVRLACMSIATSRLPVRS